VHNPTHVYSIWVGSCTTRRTDSCPADQDLERNLPSPRDSRLGRWDDPVMSRIACCGRRSATYLGPAGQDQIASMASRTCADLQNRNLTATMLPARESRDHGVPGGDGLCNVLPTSGRRRRTTRLADPKRRWPANSRSPFAGQARMCMRANRGRTRARCN